MTTAQAITDPIQVVLDRLDAVKAMGNGQWMGRCPGHPDRVPSLSIGVGDDGVVKLRCHAGCETTDVVEKMGLTMADLFPKNTSPNSSTTRRNDERKIVETYDYGDTFGVLLFQVVRYDPKDFRQRRPDPEGGWIWNLKGVERVLYRLQELTRAPNDCVVYICEGEKDADRLAAEGMIATTNPGGALKWGRVDDTPLHGRHVVILPHNDESGRKHAQDVATRLHGMAGSVRIVELPGLPEHSDVSDWLDAGNDPADLDRLASESPEWEPRQLVAAKLDRAEAQRRTRAIFKLGRTIVRAGIDLCCELLDFYEGGGLEALGDDDGPLPMAYIASGLGVTKQRVHQIIEAGRTWRGCVNFVDADMAEELTEAHLRPLAKLDPHQQTQALASAIDIAREDHEAQQAERKAAGRKPTRLRLKQKHVRRAVAVILGPVPKPITTPRKPSADADTIAVEGFRRQIAELADAAAVITNVPPDVRTIIHALARHPWSLR